MPPRKRKAISYAESDDDAADSSSSCAEFESSSTGEIDSECAVSVSSEGAQNKNKKKGTKKESPIKATTTAKSSKVSIQPKKSPDNIRTAPRKTTSAAQSTATASNLTVGIVVEAQSGNGIDITQGGPVVTEVAAKKLILQYMKQQNRPYSSIQIHDNLHKRVPKTTLEKVLTTLTSPGGGLLCKEYGKAKIYYVDQTTMTSDYTQGQLDSLQEDNEDMKQIINDYITQEKELKNQLQNIEGLPNDLELDSILHQYEDLVHTKQEKIDSLMEKCHSLPIINNNERKDSKKLSEKDDPNTLKNATKKFNTTRMAWFTRRSMCVDAVDMLCEGLNKKRREVMSDLCIETDEDSNQVLPTMLKEPK